MRKLGVGIIAGLGLTMMIAACGGDSPPAVPSSSAASGSNPVAGGEVVKPAPDPGAAAIKAGDSLKFSPASASVKVGDTVVWSNTGTVPHNITFAGPQAGLTDGTFSAGDKYAVKFTAPATYGYRCTIHPGMTGEIVVT